MFKFHLSGLFLVLFLFLLFFNFKALASLSKKNPEDRIQPYKVNPMYWQYKGKPILLIGGSDTDNAFQLTYIKEHLEDLQAQGGNYIRNTMAWSRDEDVWPYLKNETGLFDLEQFNPEFFDRLKNFLEMAYERDIIVQLEVWESWNYYMEGAEGYPKRGWNLNPFNPVNNSNYSVEASGLPTEINYSKSQYPGDHAFFYTRPEEMDLDIPRKYQEAFVDKILEVALPFPNVLYCMNNETNEAHSWGQYWAAYIQEKAAEKGLSVETSDMYDINSLTNPRHRMILDDPAYTYVDISQNNFHSGEVHYELVRFLYEYSLNGPKKPLNNTKIYGGDWTYDLGDGEEGVARFMRNLFAGAASMRFHRRTANPYIEKTNFYGLGLGPEAKAVLNSARLLMDEINPWEMKPTYDLLQNWSRNKAFTLAEPGQTYAVYFTNGGQVRLDLRDHAGTYKIICLGIMESKWSAEKELETTGFINLEAPGNGPWVVVLKRLETSN